MRILSGGKPPFPTCKFAALGMSNEGWVVANLERVRGDLPFMNCKLAELEPSLEGS